MMNFINPYVTIYTDSTTINLIPFHKEIIWTFLKNVNNRLKLFQHRLNIYLTESEAEERIVKFGSIYEYRTKLTRPLDELPEIEKRKELLNIIFAAFNAVGREYKWNIDVVNDAYSKSINQIDNFEYLTEKKLNKSKNLVGQLKLSINGRKLTFNAEIYYLDNNSKKSYKLFITNENNFAWNKMFKEFGWYDNKKFGLKFLSGDLWIVLNTDDGQIQEIKSNKKFDAKEIDKYLKALNDY